MQDMEGRHVLILGGSSGIGLATAERLLRSGAVTTIAARDGDRLASAAAALRQRTGAGERLRAVAADANDPVEVNSAVGRACDGRGQLQGAVVVSGGGGFKPVLEHDADSLSQELSGNVVPLLHLLKAAVPTMPPGAGVVAVSSTAAVQSSRFLSGYCAGKSALEGFLRVAADELGERGIRLNAIRPGLTRTGATASMFTVPEVREKYLAQVPLGRLGEADDQAGAIAFLLSGAAAWITGQCFAVDGGHTLRAFPDLSPGAD